MLSDRLDAAAHDLQFVPLGIDLDERRREVELVEPADLTGHGLERELLLIKTDDEALHVFHIAWCPNQCCRSVELPAVVARNMQGEFAWRVPKRARVNSQAGPQKHLG